MNKILNIFELYADTDKRKIEKFNSKLSSTMKVKIESDKPEIESLLIEKMEDTIEYLDNILRAPTKLIINEEEVVKIEKIKKVTVESIKHLSRNAGFIEDVDENGDVKPGKLLNVFKEETYNTYENRFIYTLIQRMQTIISREKRKLLSTSPIPTKEFKQMDYQGNSYNGKNKVDIQILLTATTEEKSMSDEKKEELKRIQELEKAVINLTLSSTYISLQKERVPLITPPLKKNNVILKNVNFQYAAKLWEFLMNEMDTPQESESKSTVKEYKGKGKAKKYIDETFLLDYLIIQNLDDPNVKMEHKKEIIEQLIANVVERTIDVNENITEEQLKNLVSKQYTVIKYKKQVTNKQIQEIFKKHIGKYVQKVSNIK